MRRRKNAECINRGLRSPRALPWAMGNIWAYSPPQSFTGRLCKLVHIHAPSAAAQHSPSKLGLCARLAQTLVLFAHELHENCTRLYENSTLCKTLVKWLGRAVSPIVALSPGQRPGERRPRLIHSAFLRLRKNATRRKRVTHYALNATRGVAPHKAGCSFHNVGRTRQSKQA